MSTKPLTQSGRPEVLAFLAAIKDRPEEDVSRLVLADWLEDHREADRAAYIRLQCELARLNPDSPEGKVRRRQCRDLEARHRDEWLGPLKGRVYKGARFDRGLLQATVNAKTFFSPRGGTGAALVGTEAWAWVDDLTVFELTAERSARMASLPLLASLNRLRLQHGQMGPEGAKSLAGSSHLGNLVHLDLSHNRIGPTGVTALLQGAAPLDRLETLELDSNGIGTPGAGEVLASSRLRKLHTLRLSGNQIVGSELQALSGVRPPPLLRSVSLGYNPIGPEGARHIATLPAFSGLEALDLDWPFARIGDEGARALAGSDGLTALTHLRLEGNDITGAGAEALTTAHYFRNLKTLSLTANHIGDDGARVLARCPAVASLRNLWLGNCAIGSAGAEELATSPYLANLGDLYILLNPLLGPEGIDQLRRRFGDRLR
jgi:uncharacterized protein (TIGR02996 family)